MNKTKQTKKNTLPSISHLKRLQKTQPSDKSNCKQVTCIYKNVKCPGKAENTASVPLILYPSDQNAAILMAQGEKTSK